MKTLSNDTEVTEAHQVTSSAEIIKRNEHISLQT